MNKAVLSLFPVKERFGDHPGRITKFVSDVLSIPIIDSKYKGPRIDHLFLPQCPFGWLEKEDRDRAMSLLRSMNPNGRFTFLSNDYNASLFPHQFKVILRNEFPNVQVEEWNHTPKDATTKIVHWNELVLLDDPLPLQDPLYNGLMYFGSFRKDRLSSFEKYFGLDQTFDLHIISSYRGLKRWLMFNPLIEDHPYATIKTLSDLAQYDWSIYIVDDCQKEIPHSIAARFWECLLAGVPILIDQDASKAMKDFPGVDEFIVNSREDVDGKLSSLSRSLSIQKQRRWISKGSVNKVRQEVINASH